MSGSAVAVYVNQSRQNHHAFRVDHFLIDHFFFCGNETFSFYIEIFFFECSFWCKNQSVFYDHGVLLFLDQSFFDDAG